MDRWGSGPRTRGQTPTVRARPSLCGVADCSQHFLGHCEADCFDWLDEEGGPPAGVGIAFSHDQPRCAVGLFRHDEGPGEVVRRRSLAQRDSAAQDERAAGLAGGDGERDFGVQPDLVADVDVPGARAGCDRRCGCRSRPGSPAARRRRTRRGPGPAGRSRARRRRTPRGCRWRAWPRGRAGATRSSPASCAAHSASVAPQRSCRGRRKAP